MEWSEPSLVMRARIDGDTLKGDYEITNKLAAPICVFDKLYDMKAERLTKDWAYVEDGGSRAVIARQVWPLPAGLRHENPEVPYARILNVGAKLAGSFSRPLPLAAADPYFHIRHGVSSTNAYLTPNEIVFRLGWAPAAELHGGVPVEIEGEHLLLFPYPEAIGKQRLTYSSPIRSESLLPTHK